MRAVRAAPWCWCFAVALTLTAAGVLSGCDRTKLEVVRATQVTIEVEAERQVAAVATKLRVRVRPWEGGAWGKAVGQTELVDWSLSPIELVILPKNNDPSRRFELVVEALDQDDVVLVQQRLVTSFEAETNTIYPMLLSVCGDNELGFVCETDRSCTGSLCRVCSEGRCVTIDEAQPDAGVAIAPKPQCDDDDCAFRCLDERYDEPRLKMDTATLKVTVLAYDAAGLTPEVLDKVKVSLCIDGGACTPTTAKLDRSGRVVIEGLPQGLAGDAARLTFEREGYLPVDFRLLRPIYDTAWETEPIFMITPDTLEALQRYKKVEVDTGLGAIATRVFDCDKVPAEGVVVSVEPTASLLYLDANLLPIGALSGANTNATRTDASGQAIAFNIDEPRVTLLIRRGRDVIVDLPIEVTPGRITYIHAHPQRPNH